MEENEATKPYRGPESYQAEDASLFFGRELETDQLVAKILSSRFTLLHAQSGAGKTSLLNAKVIPGLHCRHWLPIRVLPQSDPVEAIRVTTLQTLFPPLAVELQAIQASREALARTDEDLTVSGLLSRYDTLGVREPLRRQLVSKRNASALVKGAAFPTSGDYDPWFCRLLRGNIDPSQFVEHLAALQDLILTSGLDVAQVSHEFSLGELSDRISQIENLIGYERIINEFYVPASDLFTFFENITRIYGNRRTKFGIVLILDQFEELFTRFVDPGSTHSDLSNPPLDWRLRWELFDELKFLYLGKGDESKLLPLRFVISMRDEYIAQLDPLRRFVPDLDSCAYHLTLLSKVAAEAAVREPAQRFGYRYSEDCFHQIIEELTKEDRFIEPTHLQIVCEKLWFYRGSNLAMHSSADKDDLPRIEANDLEDLNGAAGILRSFFREFLDALTSEERVEVLEMLQLLVTSNGTRNIVERNDLTQPKFRNASIRRELLSRLQRSTIVRLESRLGGQFAEITHEFLIGPILESLRAELMINPDYNRFRYGLRILGMFESVEFRGRNGRLLSENEFRTLNHFRDQIRWDEWSIELMLRSVVSLGVGSSDLEFWRHQFESLPKQAEQGITEIKSIAKTGRALTLQELGLLKKIHDPFPEEFAPSLLMNLLTMAADHERDEIRLWLRRLVDHGAA
jgi:hypothetical protein